MNDSSRCMRAAMCFTVIIFCLASYAAAEDSSYQVTRTLWSFTGADNQARNMDITAGIEVEGLQDVAFALAPLTNLDAEEMLSSTWAGKKLQGFRNIPPADRSAVLDSLIRLAQLAVDFPDLKEIEINPLRVLSDGNGAVAVDVRIKKG